MPDPEEQALIVSSGGTTRVTTLADAMSLAMSRVREADDPDPDPYGYVQELDEAFPGAGLLEAEWQSRPDQPQWRKRVVARGRKAQVSHRFLMGQQVTEIARALNVSEATVYRDLRNLQAEWRDAHMSDIEALAGQDLARLDMLMTKLSPGIERGEVQAIKAALDVIKQRADILGYKAGVQVDVEEFVRGVAEAAGLDPNEAVIYARRISVNYRP
jgi:DNA-binding Lrp family transcriptional regulator